MVHDIWFVWRVVELLACWPGQFGNHRNSHIWIVIPHCLMCCFWREKNSRSFEDTESSMPDLKLFFFRTLLDWLSAMRNLSLFSIVDLLDLCNFCNDSLPKYTGFFMIYIILLLYKKNTLNIRN